MPARPSAVPPTPAHALPRPTTRLLYLAWGLVTLALVVAFLPMLLPLFYIAVALLAFAVIVDGVIIWRAPLPAVRRDMPHAFALGHRRDVALLLAHTGRQPITVDIHDLHPAEADCEGMPATVTLTAQNETRVPFRLRFRARGEFEFPGVQLRLRGPLGLLRCTHTVGDRFVVRVYPDFASVARYALLATDNRLSQLGIRRRQRRGDGLEFRQLRDYRHGDALRQIDSKATSRLRKLISREYQDERDQQVIFLLDCGFRMRAQDDGIAHFDAALNALLLLAHVVLRQGDAAGMLTFAGDERAFAPAKGRETLTRLMNGLFDLQPTSRTPDFRQLAADCASRLHKRSLLVLMTNIRDEDTSDLIAAARLLGERHLVLIATLREKVLDDIQHTDINSHDDAIRVAAVRLYLETRERALARLKTEGLLVLDCTPEQLPVRLVNSYLDIKRSGRL